MKKKYFIILTVIVAFCLVGAGVVYAVQKPDTVIPYERTLAKMSSPYTKTELAESGSAYLQKADSAVTADNLYQSFYDFLAAPARLYYGGNFDSWYKCDAPEINVKFAAVFKDLSLHDLSAEEFSGTNPEGNLREFYFRNALGQVTLIIHPDGITYVAFDRGENAAAYFYTEGDLSYGVEYAVYKVADYSVKAGKLEVR